MRKIYSKNTEAQLIVESCKAYGVQSVVISPGSRNAPLTIGFSGQSQIEVLQIVDERCAAFFALGIAQQLRKPVAVICTSGSALLNYYPAIAEAYYSRIPLVVISADRPAALIDIGDGQTIQQENVYGNHVQYSANVQPNATSFNAKIIKEAFDALYRTMGPIHLNVAFAEPLYEVADTCSISIEELNKSSTNAQRPNYNSLGEIEEALSKKWHAFPKKLILVGEYFPNDSLEASLAMIAKDPSVVLLTEHSANLSIPESITGIDSLIFSLEEALEKEFYPDLLVTFGGMVVSKKIKQLLRKAKNLKHWHIDPNRAYDTFMHLSKHVKQTPEDFFRFLSKDYTYGTSNYGDFWRSIWTDKKRKREAYALKVPYSDFKVYAKLQAFLSSSFQLQSANSSIVRYLQLFDMPKGMSFFCNRGTSGIDGSTTTAIGAAYASEKPVLFITGDISFFYDSNAFWNQYIPNTFAVILINNGGGGIFRIIPGPKDSNALEIFEAPHQRDAALLCQMYEIKYFRIDSNDEAILSEKMNHFFEEKGGPKLLEIQTPKEINDEVLQNYFKAIH